VRLDFSLIILLTDFGHQGPYLGQMTSVLYREAPAIPVLNLFADLPAFNPRASAYLIAAYVDEFPPDSVFLGVVDPGVGTAARQPIVVRADQRWFVGPDNGLFNIICKRANDFRRWRVTYRPPRLSASFHGRDLFAPVAARLAMGHGVPGEPLADSSPPWHSWPDDLCEVVYVDHFGNAMTGLRAQVIDHHDVLILKGFEVSYARTFGEAPSGQPFWYENANGLVEIALKEDRASGRLGLAAGLSFNIKPREPK
jgi:S-adenosylmethionine hydrolase